MFNCCALAALGLESFMAHAVMNNSWNNAARTMKVECDSAAWVVRDCKNCLTPVCLKA